MELGQSISIKDQMSGLFATEPPHFAAYLWTFQRKKRGSAEIESPTGDARSAGPESSGRARAAAWSWDRPPDQAGERAGSAIERRNGLQLSPAAPATEMDRFRVGASENNRKAKYYSITKSGRKRLARETENWERIAGV